MAKVMVSIRDENFRLLSLEARDRGITIQELIRAVIVPDWFHNNNIASPRQEGKPLLAPFLREETGVPLISRSRT